MITDGDWRDENAVGTGFAVVSDHGLVFVHAVVVRGDRSCSHIHVLAQAGVADVAEVVHLAPGPQAALFHFNKVADAAAMADVCSGPQVSKGSNAHVISHLCFSHHRLHNLDAIAQACIVNQCSWPQFGVVSDRAAATEMGLRFNHHVTTEAAVFAEGATGWVHKGDPFIHPVVPKALLQYPFALGELFAVVDAVHLIRIIHLQMHGAGQHRHGVGEVELPLIVVGAQLGQHLS